MLPVDPAGTGQPPSSPKLDSKLAQPASSAANALASPCPRVLWKWAVTSVPGSRSSAAVKNSPAYAGLAIPVVSPKPISVAPASANRSARSSTRFSSILPSYGQPKDVAMTAAHFSPSARIRPTMTSLSAIVSSTVRLTFFLLCVSDADTKTATSWKRWRTFSALSSPLLFGTRTMSDTSSGTSMLSSTCTPSASCGITSGRTKLATSIRLKPARPRALMSRTLLSVAMRSGSFWKPSRGPTSRMCTWSGRCVLIVRAPLRSVRPASPRALPGCFRTSPGRPARGLPDAPARRWRSGAGLVPRGRSRAGARRRTPSRPRPRPTGRSSPRPPEEPA